MQQSPMHGPEQSKRMGQYVGILSARNYSLGKIAQATADDLVDVDHGINRDAAAFMIECAMTALRGTLAIVST